MGLSSWKLSMKSCIIGAIQRPGQSLVEHNRPVTVQKHPLLAPPFDSRGQNLRLDVAALLDQLGGSHGVVDTRNSLLDNGTLVQIGRHEVGGGSDDLHTAVVRLICAKMISMGCSIRCQGDDIRYGFAPLNEGKKE